LAVVVGRQRPVSEVCHMFEPVPQVLRNVRFNGGAPLEDASVIAAIKDGENRLGDLGRILIRKSGTEPLIRVMAESDDQTLVDAVVSQIVEEIEKVV
jgi:phosphoglucosamine mutase